MESRERESGEDLGHCSQQSSSTKTSAVRRKRRRLAARPLNRGLWPNRKFWGLVLQPTSSDTAKAPGKEQLVTREYHLHITHATLLIDQNATPRKAAAARIQLWIANCNNGEIAETDDQTPRLICSLFASGRESQRLSVCLSGQRVRLMAVGMDCTIHLSGCLEQLPEEEEEDSSEDMWNCSDSDNDSEIESGSASDTVAGTEGGRRAEGQLLTMLDSIGDSDSDDEDFTYPTSPA